MALQALLLRDIVDLRAGGHTTSETLHAALLEVGDRLRRPVRDNRDTVARSDERTLAVDHVTITIAIGGSTELDVLLLNALNEVMGICEVGVWVSSAEVGERRRVLYRRFREAKSIDEDRAPVRAGDSVHAIKEDLEVIGVRLEEVLDQREVKDGLEQLEVVGDRVDDLHVRRPVREEALLRQIDGVKLDDLVCRDGLRLLVNGVRDALGCGTTVRHVVLDTEVGIGTSGIVGGSEEDAAIGLVLTDDVRGGRCGEDSVLTDDELSNAVGGANL